MTPLHAHARALAKAGIPVFPCVVNGKAPATPNGFKDATTDLVQIDRWWGEEPNYNVAVEPEQAGWLVVDLDPGGEENWIKLVQEAGGHDATYEVRTPRGGRHLYFAGSGPSSVQKLAGHVDTRGRGGYILVPPSIVGGRPYSVNHDRDIAPLPAWVSEALGRDRVHIREATEIELDEPQNISRAIRRLRDLVASGRVAIEGSGGDSFTYATANEVLDFGLSEEKTVELLLAEWNPHCVPPWDDEDIRTKVTNAMAYRQNAVGAYGVLDSNKAFGAAVEKLKEAMAKQPERRSRFSMRGEDEQEGGVDPTWLVQDLIQEASTVLLAGPTQSYKSFLALDIALSIAAGVETFGAKPIQGVAIYAALEGLRNIERARRRAWKIGRGVDHALPDFYTTPGPAIGFPGEMQEFGEEIEKILSGRKLRLVVIDTLAKAMAGMNENDSRDAGAFIKFCDSLVEAFGTSVIAIHHMGKDVDRGARGSSAFHAGFDTVLEVKKRDTRTKAVEVWVRKHKDAEERGLPWTFQGRSVGQSLVFYGSSAEEHKSAIDAQDPLSLTNVQKALVASGSLNRARALTTAQIAIALMGPSALGDEALVRKIERLAVGPLRTMAERDEEGWLWWLPQVEELS